MEIRIGDAERETASSRLNDHFAAGRLDHEDYSERLDAIWSARTRADLDQLFLDLPLISSRPAVVKPVKSTRTGRGRIHQLAAIVVPIVLAIMVLSYAGKFVLALAVVWFVFLRPRRSRRPGHVRRVHAELGSQRYLAP